MAASLFYVKEQWSILIYLPINVWSLSNAHEKILLRAKAHKKDPDH
jgi:hypothetical protein